MVTFRFLVNSGNSELSGEATILKISWKQEWRMTRMTIPSASTRHQHTLTFLRHQVIHTGRKHCKFHNCMKIFNLVFIQKNPTVSGIRDLSHKLQTHRKAAPLISLLKEQAGISEQRWMDHLATESSKAAKGGSG